MFNQGKKTDRVQVNKQKDSEETWQCCVQILHMRKKSKKKLYLKMECAGFADFNQKSKNKKAKMY